MGDYRPDNPLDAVTGAARMNPAADRLRYWGSLKSGDKRVQDEIKERYRIRRGDVLRKLAKLSERKESNHGKEM